MTSSGSSSSRLRATRHFLFLLAVCLLARQRLLAQAPGDPLDVPRPGLHVNHDYWSELPFENVETSTGALTLTFDDLAMPGNAAREVRFQRSYSNKTGLWSFGLAGIVLRASDPGYPTDPANTSPTLYTSDGGAQSAALLLAGSTKSTDRFWSYDRALRILYMPDGTTSQFDTTGRLTMWFDRFNNQIQFTWSGTNLTVTQQLGGGQSRVFNVTASCSLGLPGCLPSSVSFQGHTWTYSFSGSYSSPFAAFDLLVTPPAGRPWRVVRSTATTIPGPIEVTTPNGGRISYLSEWLYWSVPGTGNNMYAAVLRYRDATPGPGSTLYRREFSYGDARLIGGSVYFRQTTIRQPDNATSLIFSHDQIANATPAAAAYPGRTFLLTARRVDSPGTIENESRSYINVPVPSSNSGDSLPALLSVTITRSGQIYLTSYGYSSSNYGDFHNPNLITESGQLSRTTTLTYAHSASAPFTSPYFVGKLSGEQISDASGTVTSSRIYDMSTGFLSSATNAGITTTFWPDASSGNVTTVSKQNNKATNYTYSWGRVASQSTANVTTNYVVNVDGTVQSETTGGRTTTYSYDNAMRLTGLQPPGGTTPSITDYDNTAGSWVRTTRGSSWSQSTLDGFGRVIETVNSLGIRTRTVFDAMGRTSYRSFPYASTDVGRYFTYDGLGRITAETNPTVTRSYSANAVGNYMYVTDALGRQTTLIYVAFGDPDEQRLRYLTDAATGQWNYQYNVAGKLTEVNAPGESVTRRWVYDTRQLLQSETHPESGTTSYLYDSAGVLAQKTDARSITSIYTYDGDDRLTNIVAGGGSLATTNVYVNGLNELSSTTVSSMDGSVATAYLYDGAGRVTARTESVGSASFDVSYEYDNVDNVTAVTYPSGRTVGYMYDSEGRITRVYYPGASASIATDFQYHPSGLLTSYRTGNGVLTTVTVDPQEYLINSIAVDAWQLTYGRDAVGNTTSIGDTRSAYSQTLTYDALDRLHTASGVYGSMTIGYDAQGNRETGNGSTYGYTSKRLTSFNGMPMTYDPAGNLLTEGAQLTFTYRPDNLPSQVVVGSATTRFLYGADQWRVKKATDGQPPSYFMRGAGGELLTEWRNMPTSGAIVRDYVYAGSRLLAVWTSAGEAK